MIKIAIVDDDLLVHNTIRKFTTNLMNEPPTEECEIETFSDSSNFFWNADKYSYDLILLDIDMQEINGFEIAENISETKPTTTIIFISSMEDLVFESLRFSPFRFVRKSSLEEDITEAIRNYKANLNESRKTYYLNAYEFEGEILQRDIIYFESAGHDVIVHTKDENAVERLYKQKRNTNMPNIKQLTETMAVEGFIRIHKSFLVNYKYIYKIKRDCVQLTTGETLDMNPHKAAEFKEAYNKLMVLNS